MPERSTVNQGIQIGVESTYGVAVTANKKLPAMSIVPSPDLAFEQFRQSGNKFNSISALTQKSTAVDIEDSALTYTECIYPFSSLFGAATITTPALSTTARQWEFIVNANAADDPVSFTVQRGDGILRELFTGFVVNSLDISFEAGAQPTMSGDGFGKAMVHSAGAMDTLAGTQPALIPALITQTSVYMDPVPASPTLANIDAAFGTTKLSRAFSANTSFGNRYSRVWAIDSAQAGSSVAVVEVPVEFSLELALEADATGWALNNVAESGDARLIRIECVGGIAEDLATDQLYRITMDFYARITGGGGTDERDGVEQITWEMAMMYDATWTRAMRVRVTNLQTAL